MPDPSTTRLALYKSKSDGSELVSYTQDIGGNWDKLDLAVGFQAVTSTTRPSAPYSGKSIFQTDTSYSTYMHNGTSPASGGWVEIPNSSSTFASNLKLATSAQLVIGADVNLFRNAANVLRTNDALTVDGVLTASSTLSVASSATVGGDLTVAGIGQTLCVVKPSNTSRASTATVANDPNLTVNVAANAVYTLEGFINYSADIAGDIKTGWSTPAGATGTWTGHGNGLSVTPATTAGYTVRTDSTDLAATRSYGGISTNIYTILVAGTVHISSTAGAFTFQWAQDVSSATATIVNADSWIKLTRIA